METCAKRFELNIRPIVENVLTLVASHTGPTAYCLVVDCNFSHYLKEKQATSDKQNELFIGGIDQKGGGSGLAVIGPPGGTAGKPPVPAPSDLIDRIFERAQDRSDEESGSSAAGSSGTRRVITMYSNGFTVDDGPFRDATLPDNQLFIRSLEAGRVPPGKQGALKFTTSKELYQFTSYH